MASARSPAAPSAGGAVGSSVATAFSHVSSAGAGGHSASCRMYEAKFPEVEDLVMVNVRQIAEMGAYVRLKEYDDIEGMILLSELSRRRIRSIQKLIRIGRDEVAVVLRVDKEKGYIDLSKRRVSSEDIVKCEDKYNKSKAVQNIMRNVAESRGIPLIELQEAITWPLYKEYGHAFDAFKLALNDPEAVFGRLKIADRTIIDDVLLTIRRKMTPAPVKVRADIELSCFQYDGVEAIKSAIAAGEAFQTPSSSVKVRLVAPPLYVATANTTDKAGAVAYLEQVIRITCDTIAASGGFSNIKVAPRLVSANDDRELAELMERFEKANAEVSGDDDSDGNESGDENEKGNEKSDDDDESSDDSKGDSENDN